MPLALAIGCTSQPGHDHPDAAPAPDAPVVCDAAAPSLDAPPPVCPPDARPGSELWEVELGPGNLIARALTNLAVAPSGDVLHASPVLTELSPAGAVRFKGGSADVVTTDHDGNIYVAFVRDGHVFLDKLAPSGTLIVEIPLPPCDPSVRSIAVARDGRIAVSGPGLGTLVLDAHGSVVFQRSYDGFVAFDAGGDLAITGTFAGTLDLGDGAVTAVGPTDTFIAELSPGYQLIWKDIISDPPGHAGGQRGTGIAVAPDGSLAAIGEFDEFADVFGTIYFSGFSPELNLDGGYVVKLNAVGQPLWSVGLAAQQVMGGVAFDGTGNVIVSGAEAANASPPFRRSILISYTPAGVERWRRSGPAFQIGTGLGVAADACDIYWSAEVLDAPIPGRAGSYVLKIAP